jgi:leucyl aminopeptidase
MVQMKNVMIALAMVLGCLCYSPVFASPQQDDIFLEIGEEIHDFLKSKFADRFTELDRAAGKKLIKTDMDALPWISMLVHREFKQCGGYFTFFTEKEARTQFRLRNPEFFYESVDKNLYKLNQAATVNQLIAGVQELPLRNVILKMSSFHNRYYNAQTGVDSQAWLKSHWEGILSTRSDAKVEYFNHTRWMQPSVIASIEGSTKPDEYIVTGGHADSIAGFWGRARAKAPGADDNASGIATITEIMRVLIENDFQPQRTILFMGYAAEEVGLLGSKEIAQKFKRDGKNVVGVMQLDMTNYQGSKEDIVLVSDFTNASQNQFLGKLLDTYLPNLTWANDHCGYACSDHASWDAQGFPASAPFEAKKSKMNRSIHTKNDTIAKSGGTAEHAVKFAKLTLAFIAELGG